MVGIAAIVITVLMIWVIPVFEKMFKEMSGGKMALPGPTQLVIDMSNFARQCVSNQRRRLNIFIANCERIKLVAADFVSRSRLGRLAVGRPVAPLDLLSNEQHTTSSSPGRCVCRQFANAAAPANAAAATCAQPRRGLAGFQVGDRFAAAAAHRQRHNCN